MTDVELTVVSHEADAIFTEVMHNPGRGAEYLNKFGPHIQEWPSGYRTLGFGAEGTETTPASAIALASVGGLAVRAAAGESDAAGILSSHANQVGLTLHSVTTHTAFDSVRRGAGVIPALAVAANLADPHEQASLNDVLLGGGDLGLLLGESVNDQAGDKSNASVNALYYRNGSDVTAAATDAVKLYVDHYYGRQVSDDLRQIHTFGALARRNNALSHPRDPGSRLWLGAIVQMADAIAGRLPRNRPLERVLHPDLFEIYEAAKNQQIAVRPSAAAVHNGGGSVPRRARTALEASKLGVTKGAGSNDLAALRGSGDAAPASSFTARKAAAGMRIEAQYMGILTSGIQAYMDCRGRQHQTASEAEARRQQVAANIRRLYEDYPYLDLTNLRLVVQADQAALRNAQAATAPDLEAAAAMALADRNPDRRNAQLAAAVSAARLLNLAPDEELERHADRVAQSPQAKRLAANYLLDNINLLVESGINDLPPGTLSQYHLNLNDPNVHQYAKRLTSPSLSLLVLAADVVCANSKSVLPTGRPIRLRGPSLAEQRKGLSKYKDPDLNPHLHESKSDRRRREKESAAAAQQAQAERAETIARTLKTHLQDRYQVPIEDDLTLGMLAECAIADRMGFTTDENMNLDTRLAIAARVYKAFNRQRIGTHPVPFHEMPAEVQEAYSYAAELMTWKSKTQGGNSLRNWFASRFGSSE